MPFDAVGCFHQRLAQRGVGVDAAGDLFGGQLGLTGQADEHHALITALLARMGEKRLDYTETFIQLANTLAAGADARATETLKAELGDWIEGWRSAIDARLTSSTWREM